MEIAVSITVVRLELFDYHNCDSVSRRARLLCAQSTDREYEDCMWEGRHTLVLLVLVSIAVVAIQSRYCPGFVGKGHTATNAAVVLPRNTLDIFSFRFYHPARGTSPSEIESASKLCLAPD